ATRGGSVENARVPAVGTGGTRAIRALSGPISSSTRFRAVGIHPLCHRFGRGLAIDCLRRVSDGPGIDLRRGTDVRARADDQRAAVRM
ncbi:MAG: hypothetical protein AVDCRST_MAG64-1161, partial [uncultured Phycisphaerae bacterium]